MGLIVICGLLAGTSVNTIPVACAVGEPCVIFVPFGIAVLPKFPPPVI